MRGLKHTLRGGGILFTSAVILLALLATISWAQQQQSEEQEGPPLIRQRMNYDVAWKLQVESVARALKLDADKTLQLFDAYTTSRERARPGRPQDSTVTPGSPGETNTEGGLMEDRMRAKQQAQANFKEKCTAMFDATQSETVNATLGIFSALWDRMAAELASMEMERVKLDQAMDMTYDFMVKFSPLIAAENITEDSEALRTKFQELIQELNGKLATVLTEQQMADWKTFSMRLSPSMRGNEGRGGRRTR